MTAGSKRGNDESAQVFIQFVGRNDHTGSPLADLAASCGIKVYWLALIDLLAIAPFYLPFIIVDLRAVRTVRLLRFFRILRLGRYSEAIRLIGSVVRNKREELLATITMLVGLLIVASTLMYEAEHDTQPDKFANIPATMWWAVITLTTVGYGDVFPVTTAGKIIGAVIAVLGIGFFAMPTGVIGAGFIEQIQSQRARPLMCPTVEKT